MTLKENKLYDLMNPSLKFFTTGIYTVIVSFASILRANIFAILQRNPDKLVVDRSVTKEACWKQCETRNTGHGSVLLESVVSSTRVRLLTF